MYLANDCTQQNEFRLTTCLVSLSTKNSHVRDECVNADEKRDNENVADDINQLLTSLRPFLADTSRTYQRPALSRDLQRCVVCFRQELVQCLQLEGSDDGLLCCLSISW